MDYQIIALFLLIPVAAIAYHVGQMSKEYPSEEEMLRMIVERRIVARVRDEIEDALKTEINRRSAGHSPS